MKRQTISCPNCSSPVELNISNKNECNYCGSKIRRDYYQYDVSIERMVEHVIKKNNMSLLQKNYR